MAPDDATLEQAWALNARFLKRGRLIEQLAQGGAAKLADVLTGRIQTPLTGDGAVVAKLERITREALQGLYLDHTICAIHVPGFCPRDVAERLADDALNDFEQWYLSSSGERKATDMSFAR